MERTLKVLGTLCACVCVAITVALGSVGLVLWIQGLV